MFVDFQLDELCREHGLVTPYDPARVNPASIDLTLGREFVNCGEVPVYHGLNGSFTYARPEDRFIADIVMLTPQSFILGATAETVKIPDRPFTLEPGLFWQTPLSVPACAASLCLKSTPARHALNHSLAGWIDPGFEGQLTLELHCLAPVTLRAGQAYCQMIVHALLATPRKSYRETGRYIGEFAQGAVLARE